jgi:DNA-binding MarR family transcriptional regulator
MSFNPTRQDFSKNQILILKLLFEKDYLQNELQKALNTTAPNLHYHLSRLEAHNLIQKETLQEVGSAKINKISLNPVTREKVRRILGSKDKISVRKKASRTREKVYKSPSNVSKKFKNPSYRFSVLIFLLCLIGIVISSTLLLAIPPNKIKEISEFEELAANADIFTQCSKINRVELTADADVFTQKTNNSDFNVYDGSGATPFLRLGLYEFTYDLGGYLSEIYVRFNLPKIENIRSMTLQFTYWEGYPIEADDYYDVNVSLVSNNWVEGNTVWAKRPDYLGISTLVFLNNPGLEKEVYINLTSLTEGFSESTITIHLCPNNLSRIRFPAPFYSSESYGITPKLILKYGYPDYDYKWNRTWGGIYDDYVYTESAMTIDSSDNIYIVGRTDTTGTSNYDIMLIKYDSKGVEQWVKIWDGGAWDQGYSVLIDNANEIYVVGMTTSYADPDGDMVIIKFDSDGNQQWNFTWGGTELDIARVIVKDSLNNYYIAGETSSFGDIDGDTILVKFDSNWIEQWNVTWGGSDEDYPMSMEIDSNGDICIVGWSNSADPSPGEADVMLLKYDASGTLIWDEDWGISLTQRGSGIAIDSNNNIYFVGWTFGSSGMKGHLVKYDTNGNYQWERIWGVDGIHGNSWTGLIIDSNDGIFISGYTTTHGPFTGEGDVILFNYDTSGNQNWYKTWGMPDQESAICINMDSKHNLYLAGFTNSLGAGGYDIFLIKYLLEYKELSETQINVYDGSGATPFLRLGMWNDTYDKGGYLSEIYVRFNLPKIENISSMKLQLTYYEGYPIEVDNYYDVNVSLVSNNWVEENTIWTERPEDLGTNTIVYLHNPNLESEVYLDLTSLTEGITNTMVTIRLCPNDLSRIRFPAPFKSSESYGITPRLIIEYTVASQPIFPNTTHIALIILIVVFGSFATIALSGIIYNKIRHESREILAPIIQESAILNIQPKSSTGTQIQEKLVPLIKAKNMEPTFDQESSKPFINEERARIVKKIEKLTKICPECGASNSNQWKFCASCGKEIRKTKMNSIKISEITSGFILSILGGLSSIGISFLLAEIYPTLSSVLGESFIIIQGLTIIGGIISLIGTAIVPFYPKIGIPIILISGIIAGGNLLIIIGAIIISKKVKQVKLGQK